MEAFYGKFYRQSVYHMSGSLQGGGRHCRLPDCGTPYHRKCWDSQGRCINTALHAVGGSWGAIQQENRLRQGGRVCPHCQHVNLADAKQCESCKGSLLSEEEENQRVRIPLPDGTNVYFDAEDPCCGLPPDEKIEGERLGDVANFIRTNTLYYIPLFRRFRDSGRTVSLNLSCALFPHLYFAPTGRCGSWRS